MRALGFDLSDVEAEAHRLDHLERTARRALDQARRRFNQGWIAAVEAVRFCSVEELDALTEERKAT